MIRRLIGFCLLSFLLLAGCGGGDNKVRDAQKLADEITKASKGMVSVRKRRIASIDKDVVFVEQMESLSVERADEGDGYQLRLRKWYCVEKGEDPCGPKSVPVDYLLDIAKINDTLIGKSTVYRQNNESGSAIQLRCLPDATCLKFDDYGEFGRYRSCKERKCNSGKDLGKPSLETAAELYGNLRAESREELIECAAAQPCEEIKTSLKKLVTLLQRGSRTEIKSANAEIAKLAKTISTNANDTVSRRYDEKDPFNNRIMGTAGIGFAQAEDQQTTVRQAQLVRRVCYDADRLRTGKFDDQKRCDDKNSLISISKIDLARIDPASIYVASPDEAAEEAGLTVEFRCQFDDGYRKSTKRPDCITHERVGTVDGFELCDDELCRDETFLGSISALALHREQEKARNGIGRIDCRTEELCRQTADNLRQIASLAVNMVGRKTDETPQSPAYKARRIAAAMNEGLTGVTISNDVGAATKYAVNVTEIAFRKPSNLILYTKFLSKQDTDLKDQRISAEHGAIIIDLSRVDIGSSFAAPPLNGYPAIFSLFCVGAERCARIALGDHESDTTAWIIPARDEAAAKAMKESLREIVALTSEQATTAEGDKDVRPQAAGPATRIRNKRDAEKAAERITGNLAPRHFSYQQGNDGKIYKMTNVKMSMATPTTSITQPADGQSSPPALLIDLVYNIDAAAQSGFESGAGKAEIFLAGIKRNELAPEKISDGGNEWIIRLESAGENAVQLNSGSRETLLLAKKWVIECKNKKACEDIAKDLRGLIDFAAASLQKGTIADDALRDDDDREKADEEATIHADLSRAMRRHVNNLHRATQEGDAHFRVTFGEATRLMRVHGASVNGESKLIVHREACLALMAVGFQHGDECKLDTLFQDYDLRLDLARLDRRSIKSVDAANDNGERGRWVEAICDEDEPCASLVAPDAPHLKRQANSIMQSYGETDYAPKIRIPCADKKSCDQAAKALRELVKGTPKPKRQQATREKSKTGDLVGVWYLQQPYRPDWVVEYRADGTYLFTMPVNTRIDGVYEAVDGRFKTEAQTIGSNDNGTYRMLDENTLEMNGNLGRSVWKRRS